ncbi:MAG: cytochrome c biogenesis protein ResB [Deltaproteobacteria bacterium]|nr:cytochrome c biogenesis protein ResB [Deltaproteobacteria bacterium]MBW2132123.1 cytochrome c biogenesis protein ResB [Deltaproteobacteria bacterium]
MKPSDPNTPAAKIWDFFASVRLTVVLLLILAATSTIGTLVPQNASPSDYFNTYGPFLYRLFAILDIFDMYHSWWFQFLLLLLTLNIIVCSLNRLSGTWKIVFRKNPGFVLERFRKIPNKPVFNDSRPLETLKPLFVSRIKRRFGTVLMEDTEKGFCVFAEKGRWTRLGVYTVHLSVILLLIGALVGSFFGFEGFVTIPEGQAKSRIRLRKTGVVLPLDFAIRCDAFHVSFYESGTPKEFRSDLTIVENGNPVAKKSIRVNDPMHYKGISIFQSSYGKLPPDTVTLKMESEETKLEYRKKASAGQKIDLPEGAGSFIYRDFKSRYFFRGRDLGETVFGTLIPPGGTPKKIVLPLRFPGFDRMRKDTMVFSVETVEPRYYTGLQVSKDPGVWVVYSGFMIMIVGCYITFFMSHKRLCVEVMQKGNGNQVHVTGTANKNKMSMDAVVDKMARELAG